MTSAPRCRIQPFRQHAQECYGIECQFRRIIEDGMCPWIPERQDGAHEQVHHALLFVLIGLISQRIECEDRTVGREHRRHQGYAVEVVPTRLLLHIVDQRYGRIENRLATVAVSIEIDAYGSYPRMK